MSRLPASPALVTGARGFIGSAVTAALGPVATLSLGATGWREAIRAAPFRDRVVVHLAARTPGQPGGAAQYREDNVDKATELAKAAAAAGAARFVLMSTAKVHGEESGAEPVSADSPGAPADEYARSKWLAEQAVRDIAERAGMSWVVLRPPLVYGRGAGGNFRALVRMADSPLWLPLAGVRNQRSVLHVQDLADAVALVAGHSAAAGRVYLPAHPQPVSTPALVTEIRAVLGRPPRLVGLSSRNITWLAGLVGVSARVRKLTGSFVVDPGPLERELGWAARFDLAAGLQEALS